MSNQANFDPLDRFLLDSVRFVIVKYVESGAGDATISIVFPSMPSAEQMAVVNRLRVIPGTRRHPSGSEGFTDTAFWLWFPKNIDIKGLAHAAGETLALQGSPVKVLRWDRPEDVLEKQFLGGLERC